MMDRDSARRLMEKALMCVKADEAEVHLEGGRRLLTRFAQNRIHQHVQDEGYRLSIRAAFGRRTGAVTTNLLNDDAIRRATGQAAEIARRMPEDPELLTAPEPQVYRDVTAYDDRTASAGPEDLARRVAAVIAEARAKGAVAAGALCVIEGRVPSYGDVAPFAVMNSHGLFAYYPESTASFSTTMSIGDGSGWAGVSTHRLDEIPVEELGRRAIEKALASRAPREVPPGRYTAVLEPEAVSNVMDFVTGAFSGLAVEEGRSFVTGKAGTKIGADAVTLVDDAFHPMYPEKPFDEEGWPRRRVVMIEKGSVRDLLHDRRTAKKAGVEPTGHGLRVPNIWGPMPAAPVMEGGAGSTGDLIRDVKRGILVTRFWYSNTVDPRQGIVTGMTRDGLFWIENGEVAHPIKHFRYNTRLEEFLKGITRLSEPVRTTGMTAPAAVVEDFNFASGTSF